MDDIFDTLDLTLYAGVLAKYDDSVQRYCADVLTGRILAGRLIKLAALRQLNDLRRIEEDASFRYDYDSEKAEGMIRFGEFIPDVSTGEGIKLAGFQKFILGMLDGWKDPKTSGARFHDALISMARTNGKTQVASILALRDLLFGFPRVSRQIVIASNNMSQVRQLFDYIKLSLHALEQTPLLEDRANSIIDNTQEIRIEAINTKLLPMSADSLGADSVHPTLAIYDEFHLQKNRNFLDTLTSGNVQNPDSRLIVISTAGTNPNVPMYDDYKRLTRALEDDALGKRNPINDSQLFLCWEQDDDEEAFKPETWIKSNPLMELEQMKINLTNGVQKEIDTQQANNTLAKALVKNLNRWQNAKQDAFLPLDLLEKAVTPEFSIDGRDVYVGFDYSMVNDNTAIAFVFPYYDSDGSQKWHIIQHSFIPTKVAGSIEAKETRDGVNYRGLQDLGYCTITRDRFGMINQDEVFQYMLDYIEDHKLNVMAICHDAWGTGSFIRHLDELREEWLIIPVRQGAHSLSEPTKFLLDRFTDGSITRPDDDIQTVAFNNAVIVADNNGIKVDKNTNSAKIDVVDATVDAFFEAAFYFNDFTNVEAPKVDKHNPFKGWSNDKINEHFKGNFGF